MKRATYTLIKALWVLTMLVACHDDDPETSGYITVDSDRRQLASGFVQKGASATWLDGTVFYAWEVYLVSEGITRGDGFFSGKGDTFYIRVFVRDNNSDKLPPGRFEYRPPGSNDTPPENFCGSSWLKLDYSNETGGGTAYGLVAGQVIITKIGEHYILRFNGAMAFGEVIEGEFKGVLQPL